VGSRNRKEEGVGAREKLNMWVHEPSRESEREQRECKRERIHAREKEIKQENKRDKENMCLCVRTQAEKEGGEKAREKD